MFEGLVGESIMLVCEFYELIVCVKRGLLLFGFGLELLLCMVYHVSVLLGIGMMCVRI